MKKINSKGLTLTELIVSFAIVAVAVVYFYQTLYTVRKLYKTAQDETQEYVDKNYAIRLVDAYIDKNGTDDLSNLCGDKYGIYCKEINVSGDDSFLKKITITKKDGNAFSFYKFLSASSNNGDSGRDYGFELLKAIYKENDTIYINSPNRLNIIDIKFIKGPESVIPTNYDGKIDVSSGNKKIYSYYYKIDSKNEYKIIIRADSDAKMSLLDDCTDLFSGYEMLEEIDFEGIGGNAVENMTGMFSNCLSLKKIVNLKAPNVKIMTSMFYNSGIERFEGFKANAVENTVDMFDGCTNLEYVDMDGVNFKDLYATRMFSGGSIGSNKENIVVKNFNIKDAKDLSEMFANCGFRNSGLILQNFFVDGVDDASGMLGGTKFYDNKVEDISLKGIGNGENMFKSSTIERIDLKDFSLKARADISYMFYRCTNLKKIDNLDISGAYNVSYMFSESGIETLNNFKAKNLGNMEGMFKSCISLKQLDLKDLSAAEGATMEFMFELSSIEKINKIDATNVENMYAMFSQSRIKEIDEFITSNKVTNLRAMFNSCTELENLNLSHFNTTNVTNMSYMFTNCTKLTNLDLSSFVTSNVTDMSYMFSASKKLQFVDISKFTFERKPNIKYMFGSVTADVKVKDQSAIDFIKTGAINGQPRFILN